MDFRKAFQDKSLSIEDPSGLWQQYIQAEAPPGTHYEKIGDDDFHLVSNTDRSFQMNITQFFPKEWKELGAKDFDDYLELFYRNQKQMEIDLDSYIVAGNEVSKEEIIRGFTTENPIDKSKYYLMPEKFPPLPDLPITINGIVYNFKIERKPLLNLSKQLIETIDDGIFYIKIIVDEQKRAIDIHLSYNFSRAKDLEDLVNHKEMILNYHRGQIEIFGQTLPPYIDKTGMDIDGYLEFCTRLLEVSKYFNLDFDISKNVTVADILNCNRVYESFINDHFYLIAEEKIEEFTMTPDQDTESLDLMRKK